MKTIVTSLAVDIALNTLTPERLRQVHAWFDHLANWDSDSFVRDNSYSLSEMPGVRVFRPNSDYRIFFKIEDETITILDLAKRESILRTFAH